MKATRGASYTRGVAWAMDARTPSWAGPRGVPAPRTTSPFRMCSRIKRAASGGVSMSGRQDLGPVPREVGDRHEPRGVREAEHREVGTILGMVRHHGHPVSRVVDRRVEQRVGPRRETVHLDLRQRSGLETLDQHDIRSPEVAASQGDRVRLLLRPLPQDPLSGPLHEDALGVPFVPVAPGVLAALVRVGGVGAVLDRHYAEFPTHELRRERDQERGLAGVLAPDDRYHPCCRHAASARSRSAGEFTLKNSRSGSPSARTRSSGSVPTFTSAWKPIARRSPSATCRSMAAAHAGPYTAHSGSTPRRPSLSGRNASQPVEPSSSARSKSMVTNGMSHATHSTGPAPDTMAVWIPPRLPLPGRTSGMVRRSGRQVGPSGALAMSTGGSSVAVLTASTTRSRMRRPPSSTSPLGCPP